MKTENTTTQATPATCAVVTMGRKVFNGFIQDLYRGKSQDDIIPDFDLYSENVYRIEVFESPDGLVIAAHELDEVHVFLPKSSDGARIAGKDDENRRAAHGNARDLQEAIDGTLALIGAKRGADGKIVKAETTAA